MNITKISIELGMSIVLAIHAIYNYTVMISRPTNPKREKKF